MLCIFCKENKKPSEEHIIPRNVGGSVVTYQVCETCNSIFGSEVDSELIMHAHIFEAYKELDRMQKPDIKFVFRESAFETPKGLEIKVSRDSLSSRIRPTKISETEFIVDISDTKFVFDYIKKERKQKGFSDEFISEQISDYLQWAKSKQANESYINEKLELTAFSIWVNRNIHNVQTNQVYRLAKLC
jgi:HNH endonuclease